MQPKINYSEESSTQKIFWYAIVTLVCSSFVTGFFCVNLMSLERRLIDRRLEVSKVVTKARNIEFSSYPVTVGKGDTYSRI